MITKEVSAGSQRRSYQATELHGRGLLELLISVYPDVSYALYTYLRMGDTPLTLTAKKPNWNEDKSGQRVLDDLKDINMGVH